jgi:uncharacterized repeat protein (TIGR01451 family)
MPINGVMHRRPGLFFALLALLCLAPTASAFADTSDLKASIDGRPDPVAAGQYVSYAISVTNNGPDAAGSLVADVKVPPRTQYVPGDSRCSLAAGHVKCADAALASGATDNFEVVLRLTDFSAKHPFTTTVIASSASTDPNPADNTASDVVHVLSTSHDHHITVSKSEAEWDFDAGQTSTVTLSCPNPGDIMLDGSVKVLTVDQGTGTLRSLVVTERRAVGDGYAFTATNDALGRAQTKVFGTCISKTTQGAGSPSHTHQVVAEAPQTVTVNGAPVGHTNIKVACNSADDVFAAAPGFVLSNGAAAELVSSKWGLDANGEPAWDFGFDVTAPGDITASIRCVHRYLTTTQNHTHELWLSQVDKVFSVPANAPAAGDFSVSCSDEAKGIVAGYELPFGIHDMGHDPQPKTRVWKLLNDSGGPLDAHLYLLCVGDRTGTDPPPPAAARSVAPSASRTGSTLRVVLGCPPNGCSGTLTIAGQTQTFASHTARSTQRIKLTGKYRHAKRLTAVVRDWRGKVVRRSKIRVR